MEKTFTNVSFWDIVWCATPMSWFTIPSNAKILNNSYEAETYCDCKWWQPLTSTTENYLSVFAWLWTWQRWWEWVSGWPYNTVGLSTITCEVPKDPNALIKSTDSVIGWGIEWISTNTALWAVAALIIWISLIISIQEGIFDLINKWR